jgi:hypothetical protein
MLNGGSSYGGIAGILQLSGEAFISFPFFDATTIYRQNCSESQIFLGLTRKSHDRF